MKKLCLIMFLLLTLSSCREIQKSNVLPKKIEQARYTYSDEKELKIAEKDLFSMTKEELFALSQKKFEKEYDLEFPLNERDAVDIATMAFVDNNWDCNKTETPFLIKYNEKADCYIIYGTKPFFSEGGIGICAVEKQTGKVVMLIHT